MVRHLFIRALVLTLTGFLTLAALCARGEQPKPNVFVVFSYHIGMPWVDNITSGLQESLGSQAELVITQLDIKRFPPYGRENELLAVFSSKASMCAPRLVIAIDDFAYQFVLAHRDRLPPNTPIVFGGVNFWDGTRPPGVTGLVEANDLATTLQLMVRLQPQARRWVIVNDQSETGLANHKALEAVLPQFGQHEILWLGNGSYVDTEKQLAQLDPVRDAVLLLSWNLDKTGLARSYEEAVTRARAVCPAALYGVWDFYFGHGIVGGSLLDGRTHGHEVGDLAKRLLAGESAGAIPVITHCRTRLMIDARELERFSIKLDNLPAGAEINFHTPSPWEKHAGVILTGLAIIVLQGATISWLILIRLRRKQAVASLREGEANLRLTLDSIDEAVIVTNPKAQITRINPAAEKLTGYSSTEVTGKPLASILPLLETQSGQPVVLPSLPEIMADRAKTLPAQALLKNRAGAESIVVYSQAPMLDDTNSARGIVVVLRDVTTQHRLEEQLYQAQKMESIGQLAGGIAHDFNNILAVIVGYGEILREQLQNQPSAAEDLQMMLRGAQRATDLVQQILAFSRKTKHERSPILMQTVLKEALKFLRSTVPSSIEIVPRISTDLPLVLADPTQIYQVVMNLSTNAVHAMRGTQGRLEVRLEAIHADTEFAVNHAGLREGEYVRLSMSDTGHGMDEATLKHIFEPFFTTKGQGEGTGLGLSVVLGIVQAHGGGIFVYSRPGEGTIFHLYLPALSIARDDASATTTSIPPGNGERILFVDDEPAICGSARRVAESLGYRVTTFNNPLAALEHFKEHTSEFDLLVTDLTMPGTTGIELADAVRKIRSDLPIILTTGFAAELTENSLQAQGISKLLLKPFTTTSLAQALGEVLRKPA